MGFTGVTLSVVALFTQDLTRIALELGGAIFMVAFLVLVVQVKTT